MKQKHQTIHRKILVYIEMQTLNQFKIFFRSHRLRNQELRDQIKDVYSRYLVKFFETKHIVKANSYSIIKVQKKSVSEKIHLNDFLVLAYPDYADRQKGQMEKKKDQLQKRLETLKDLNRKENINFYEIMNKKYDNLGLDYLDQIKARREQLEREVMETKKMLKKGGATSEQEMDKKFIKEFKDIYGSEYYDKKPPTPQPQQEKVQKLSEREILDDFLVPGNHDYDNKRFLSSYQPEIKEVKNLQQYINLNNPSRPPIHDLPKQSMLDKFIMKGGSHQNLNGSFRVAPSARGEDPKKTLSGQKNRHNHSVGHLGNAGQIDFDDSREHSPEQAYQHNASPYRPQYGNQLQVPGRNVNNINYPYSNKGNSYNQKKFE